MNSTQSGKVKFFNEEKGFGFIQFTNSDKDIFFHKSGTNEYLEQGDEVEFTIGNGTKGQFAFNIICVN